MHAGVVLVALQQARTLPRLLAGSGAELPPIARALRALETLPTVLEALLYVPQPTVVRLAVWACLVVGAAAPLRDTEATAADGSTAVAASDGRIPGGRLHDERVSKRSEMRRDVAAL